MKPNEAESSWIKLDHAACSLMKLDQARATWIQQRVPWPRGRGRRLPPGHLLRAPKNAVDQGSWLMGHGRLAGGSQLPPGHLLRAPKMPLAMFRGAWSMDVSCAMGHSRWPISHDAWPLGHGPWCMVHGSWVMESWTMAHGAWSIDRGA